MKLYEDLFNLKIKIKKLNYIKVFEQFFLHQNPHQ